MSDSKKKYKSSSQPRAVSASEIARNLDNFETWSSHQCCEQVSLSDPPEFQEDVNNLFGTTNRIPRSWLDRSASNELFEDVCVVFSAWKHLAQMRSSKEKWSEVDFVANIQRTLNFWNQRKHLPGAMRDFAPTTARHISNAFDVPRVLNTKTVIPDCAIFIPTS
ncbi:uncharacterized protein HD556DRAFT_1449798 [Suillus plorans]|uniref:Uncharacterized protein n=1 Tax=Suillus plorans TaxID=116603 RepID=A0A9P7DBN1_9AGAM|nr:uncharacterized protein HD556DRAFT_1449798 [Suillus plorans]KAG1786296.1 hypothetical protein HD556DRAFT_1449798 [Suillus plorans]